MSRCVWALVPETITEHMDRTTEPEAKLWLFSMIHTLNQEDLTRCLVTLWAIWFARRKAIHEETFQSPLSTHLFVKSFIRDLELAAARQAKPNAPRRQEPVIRWIAPPRGTAKINVDAAVRKNGKIGAIAAVCRNDEGRFLGASAVVLHGIHDPAVLETLACREALALAEDLNLLNIKVASDCLEAINSMRGNYLGKLSMVAREIRLRARDFASATFVHERRSSNVEAHGLARSSAYRELGRHVWLTDSPDDFCIPSIINR